MITIDLSILNQKGTPMFYSDIFADRPPFGIAGRIFISTDTKEFYRDTGTSWELLAGPGGGTITGSGTATQVAFFNSSSSITGNNDLWWDNSNSRLGIGNNNPASNLDIHGNNATIQIDGRSTSSAFVQFVTQGVLKWRIGNLSPSNYFQIYDNANSLERVKLENTGLFTLTGKINNNETTTAVFNDGWYGVYSNEDITINAGQTFTGGNSFGSLVGRNLMRYQGNATFPNAAVPASILGTNVFNFPNAGSTITITQGTGVRAFSAINAFNQLNSVNSGTITHIAGLHVLAPYRATGGVDLTCINYYGLLINASNERTAFTITNAWGIYQEGSSDKNYLNGTTLIGTNVDTLSGAKLQVSGAATFSSSVTAGDSSTISKNQNATTSLTISNTTSGTVSDAAILFTSDTSSGTTVFGKKSSGTTTYKILSQSNAYWYNGTAGDIAILNDFATGSIKLAAGGSSTAQLTLNSSGNLGIGVTPSAWGSDTAAIQLGGSVFGAVSASLRLLNLANAYNDGTNFRYINSGVHALQYRISGGTGAHEWYTAPSGTAGNAISFTQAMTLTASGNLGIGETNPVSYRLQVKGPDGQGIQYEDTNGVRTLLGSFSSEAIVGTLTNHAVGFWTNNSRKMIITSSGNVGIGTTTPGQKLVVQESGDAFIQIRNNTAAQNFFIGALSTETRLNNDNSTPMTMWVNGSERLRITSSGRTLIGTTTDNTVDLLQVEGSVSLKTNLKMASMTTSGTAGSIVNYVQVSVNGTNYLLPLYNLP